MRRLLKNIGLTAAFFMSIAAHSSELEIATVHVPPYVIVEESGELSGIAVDLVSAAGKRCNLHPNFKIMGWARAVHLAEHGEIPAVMPLAHAPGRREVFHFHSTPLFDFEMTVFARQDAPIAYDGDLASLKGLTVGTLRNIVVSDMFEEAIQHGVFIRSKRDSYKALAHSLSRKRLDVFVGEKRMGEWAISDLALQGSLKALPPALRQLPVYVAFSKAKNSETVSSEFNACLEKELAAGTLETLVVKYGVPPVHTAGNR